MLECRVAGPSETIEAFRQVHGEWPHAADCHEHVARRLASVQHRRATWFVGCLEGRVVCSLGAYPYQVFGPGGCRPVRVVGAVYTPEEHRRQGFASHLIKHVSEFYEAQGVTDLALFSDIGLRYYESLGFRALPSWEWSFPVADAPVPSGWSCVDRSVIPVSAGALGCSFGFLRQPDDDAWIMARCVDSRLSYWSSTGDGDTNDTYWLLSKLDSEGKYTLLESNIPQSEAAWKTFKVLVAADARSCGATQACGWWTSHEARPGKDMLDVLPRNRELLMWLSLRGPLDPWFEQITLCGFRVFRSEHV